MSLTEHRYRNHGDGNPDSTRTPLVAWGSGVRPSEKVSAASGHDEYSLPWDLVERRRQDVEQADIAPLMVSSLIANFGQS